MVEFQHLGTEEAVNQNLKDIEDLSQVCKFNNCRHQRKPGCKIIKTLESGELDYKHYEGYLKQLRVVHHLDSRKKVYDRTLSKKEKLKAKINYKK